MIDSRGVGPGHGVLGDGQGAVEGVEDGRGGGVDHLGHRHRPAQLRGEGADAGVGDAARDDPVERAEVGVAVQREPVQGGVTLHGFALNCTTDLGWFDAIVPCGLADRGVATLSELAGREVTVAEMAPIVAARFGEVFGLSLEPAPIGVEVPAPALR